MTSFRRGTDAAAAVVHSLGRAFRGGGLGRSQPGLTVLAYHRVGARSEARFDPGVFTADANQLEEHIRYIKKHMRLVGLEEAMGIALAGQGMRQRFRREAVLLTFDDGYLDNYQTAFPILQAHGVDAVFFLVSSFAAGGVIPWWDQIAWLVNATRVRRIRLAHPGGAAEFDLQSTARDETARQVLEFYKAGCSQSPEDFILQLEGSCEIERPQPAERLFLSWSEARTMLAAGMKIGAHTHSHPILARLSAEEQMRELRLSKLILEKELGARVDVMAYPVGGPGDFTEVTQQALEQCGYRAAFSFHGGFNPSGKVRRFDMKRIPVYWGARAEWLFDAS